MSIREWEVYARKSNKTTESGEDIFLNIYSDERMLRMCGFPADQCFKLLATEDPNGFYAGWVDTGVENIKMIQIESIFDMQFPYGVQEEIKLGRGEKVNLRLSIVN